MNIAMKISEELKNKLICPKTKNNLKLSDDWLININNSEIRYPIVDGIAVLINEENSIFDIETYIQKRETTFKLDGSKIKKRINDLMPEIGHNLKAKENYTELISILPANAKIMVIGGSIVGAGMEKFYLNKSFEIVGTDVSYGPQTQLIVDAHDIPFAEATFDCVIVQAVLEHVLDPQRCVAEIHRVLKPEGIVYAETPFMQQVHMQQYDFTRFTHLGHRRLFRYFGEIKSGPLAGPGTALAWSYLYFLRSFFSSLRASKLIFIFARLTSFFLKYFDYFVIHKPGCYDAASGYFFIGKKNDKALADKDLIQAFKGIH